MAVNVVHYFEKKAKFTLKYNAMNDFFKELFAYSHHCNRQIAELLALNTEAASGKTTQLFSHILNAHHIWNSRIMDQRSGYKVWDIHAPQDYKAIDASNYTDSLHILDHYDLERTIHYTNSQGQAFDNSVRDILFHVINHSTYHRAQIASDLKQSGITPLITDYIFYKR